MMTTVGRHLLAELYSCDPDTIDDLDAIRRTMLEAAAAIGATSLGEMFHRFSPSGVSGVVFIAESHLAVHTWPEGRYVAIDIYSCGGLDPVPGFVHIERFVGAQHHRVQEIVRGLPGELEEIRGRCPPDAALITDLAPLRCGPGRRP